MPLKPVSDWADEQPALVYAAAEPWRRRPPIG